MQSSNTGRPAWISVTTVVAMLFVLATLKFGGEVLFIDGDARLAAGAYVPFVVWFNFVAGNFYVAAGIGLWLGRHWGAWLALTIAIATLITFAALGLHIAVGGAFEARTVGAMTIRLSVWAIIGAIAYWKLLGNGREHTKTPG